MASDPSEDNLHGSGFSRISVAGFKSLAVKTDVEIRPLTVLAGANSSGKSSLMQPLLLMKQTLESSVNQAGPFLLSGPYTRYTEAKQFLSRVGPGDASLPLRFEFGFDDGLTAGMAYSGGLEASLTVTETWGSKSVGSSAWRIAKKSSTDELREILLRFGSIPLLMAQVGFTVLSAQDYEFYQSILFSVPTGSEMMRRESYFMQENLALNNQIRRLIYVPGLRGDQLRKWLLTDVRTAGQFEGPFEAYVPSLINSWESVRVFNLVSALTHLGLASGIGVTRLNESEVELSVPRAFGPAASDHVNVADVGLAVSTVLPVLVALIQAQSGQLVNIEQPELHLHPKAQVLMAQLLVNAANRGVRLVIETHSSLLLQGILTCIAKGAITRDNVALHWFTRNEDGVTKVTTAEVDAEGRFGDWPVDFDSVELKASNDYLDAVETRLMADKSTT